MVAVTHALARAGGGGSPGTLQASNIWIGEPTNTGSVLSTTGCRMMDTTALGAELDSALSPTAYDIGQGVTFSPFGIVDNDGQLATWRPDIDNTASPTAQVANGEYVHQLAFPNGEELRAGAIGPASRVMMLRHSETPSVDADGNIDPAAVPYWQVLAPLSMYGLMDVEIPDPTAEGDILAVGATNKWGPAIAPFRIPVPSSEPSDGDIPQGKASFWVVDAGDSGVTPYTFGVKYHTSDGTFVTATLGTLT